MSAKLELAAGLKGLSPMAAAFTRGFMEEMSNSSGPSLKGCGLAGKEAVEELEMDISVKYISNLTSRLQKWGVIQKVRRGKHFNVTPGPHFDLYFEWLSEDAPEGWGQSAVDEAGVQHRLKAHRMITDDVGVLITQENRVPREAFSFLMKQFNAGDLDLYLVPKDTPIRVVERDEDGKAKARKVKTWS